MLNGRVKHLGDQKAIGEVILIVECDPVVPLVGPDPFLEFAHGAPPREREPMLEAEVWA